MSAEVREIHYKSHAANDGEAEVLHYLLWAMKHDVDPHESYDDPIKAFRDEMLERYKNKNVA